MIRDFNINPSWADIPLPPGTDNQYAQITSALHLPHASLQDLKPMGRSLNSCQMAFYSMCPQHVQLSVNPSPAPFPPPRHESSALPAPTLDSNPARKRPLFPSDKPILAPRAIQPRPTTSTASFSSESGVSALLSPGSENMPVRGEPPRKRGRPSKAESERRKAAAEARGETYPPPRRSGSNRMKAPSTPTSPSSIEPLTAPFQASGSRYPNVPQPELHYAPPPGRPPSFAGFSENERRRDAPIRDMGPTMRDLPRPPEMRQTLPSPRALHLGRETIARMESGERPFEQPPSERMSFNDSSRRSLIHTARHPEEPAISGPEIPLHASAERRAE
ncbi:hypothetical protein BBP40_002420 [Aspergillus hancockii]|nr:hypothetical protein BBP40_002420 [Aspergillus hancockii]